MRQVPSPNFDKRASDIELCYIVLHYTGMKTSDEALARLSDKEAKVSAHYMIEENGEITQLVDEKNRAWHAGVSTWRGISDVNSASIGIELVNPGHEHGYRPFPDQQIQALKILLRDITRRHSLNSKTCLLAHSDVAPARKEDPGEFFPWKELAKDDLGVWPSEEDGQPETNAAWLLQGIGYDVADIGKSLLAFQRRFYPDHLTGEADTETLRRLQSVKQLLS